MTVVAERQELSLSSTTDPESFPKFRKELEDFCEHVKQKTGREMCLVGNAKQQILKLMGPDDFDFTMREGSLSIFKVRFHNGKTCVLIKLNPQYKFEVGKPMLRHEGINYIMRYLAAEGVLSNFSVDSFSYSF